MSGECGIHNEYSWKEDISLLAIPEKRLITMWYTCLENQTLDYNWKTENT